VAQGSTAFRIVSHKVAQVDYRGVGRDRRIQSTLFSSTRGLRAVSRG